MNQILSWNKLWAAIFGFVLAAFVLSFGRTDVQAATAPTGLRQTKATDTSFTVEWNKTFGNSTKVWTRISDNESMSPCTYDYTYSATSEYFYGLNPGQTYYVEVGVTESNSLGNTPPADTAWSAPLKAVTAPANVPSETIKFIKATTDSLSFTWEASIGATSYNVVYYLASANAESGAVAVTDTNSITIGGLQADTEYSIRVEPVRTEPSTGYVANYNSTLCGYIPTLPKGVSGLEVVGFNSNGYISIEWNKCNVSDGYEVEIYQYNGKKALIKESVTSSYLYTTNKKLKTTQFYKYRVRAYVTNADNNKSYSTWSAYQYTARKLDKATVKKSGSKMKVSWSKVKGSGSYIVYMTTKSSSNTYKKMGTTSKTNFTINKKLKKGTDYYIRIVPAYKKGKKVIAGYAGKTSYTVHVWYSSTGRLYVYNS